MPLRVLFAALFAAGALTACGDDGGQEPAEAPEVTAVEIEDAIDLSAGTGETSPSGRATIPGFGEVAVEVTNQAGDVLEWCLLLAAAAEQWTQGLMRVVDLGDYDGMLFDFPDGEERTGGFWMQNTPMPLTVAYLDDEGRIVSTADMDPCVGRGDDCPSYPPSGPYSDTVEVPQGGLEALGLDGPDARLVQAGSCAAA